MNGSTRKGRCLVSKIDLELNAFLKLDESLPFATAEVPDAVESFFQDARLDSAIGKSGTAVALRTETQEFNARAERILKHAAPARADWDTEITDDAHRLEKRYVAGIHSGKKASRVEKSANGRWVMEYDERGELIRGYIAGED